MIEQLATACAYRAIASRVVAMACLALAVTSLQAEQFTRLGDAPDQWWHRRANWNPSTGYPGEGDIARFGGANYGELIMWSGMDGVLLAGIRVYAGFDHNVSRVAIDLRDVNVKASNLQIGNGDTKRGELRIRNGSLDVTTASMYSSHAYFYVNGDADVTVTDFFANDDSHIAIDGSLTYDNIFLSDRAKISGQGVLNGESSSSDIYMQGLSKIESSGDGLALQGNGYLRWNFSTNARLHANKAPLIIDVKTPTAVFDNPNTQIDERLISFFDGTITVEETTFDKRGDNYKLIEGQDIGDTPPFMNLNGVPDRPAIVTGASVTIGSGATVFASGYAIFDAPVDFSIDSGNSHGTLDYRDSTVEFRERTRIYAPGALVQSDSKFIVAGATTRIGGESIADANNEPGWKSRYFDWDGESNDGTYIIDSGGYLLIDVWRLGGSQGQQATFDGSLDVAGFLDVYVSDKSQAADMLRFGLGSDVVVKGGVIHTDLRDIEFSGLLAGHGFVAARRYGGIQTDDDGSIKINGAGAVAPQVHESPDNPVASSFGSIEFGGDLTLTGTYDADIGFDAGGELNSDHLEVDGVAVLGGLLSVGAISYTPSTGDSFSVLSSNAGVAGEFNLILLPSLGGGLELGVEYGTYDVWVVVSGIEGDYNYDGVVDAADYTVWRDWYNDPLVYENTADGNHNGVIDEGDYDVWRTNYGMTLADLGSLPTRSLTVPEPASLALLISAGLLARVRRR